MRKLWIVPILMLLGSVYASANTVTLTLDSFGNGSNDDGHYYVYPYPFSINGSSAVSNLVCDDFNDDVFVGESWTATVNNIFTITNPYTGTATTGGQMASPLQGYAASVGDSELVAYENAAYLFQHMVAQVAADGSNASQAQTDAVEYNHAIWALFSSTAYSLYGSDTTVTGYLGQANGFNTPNGGNNTINDYSNVVFYTPDTPAAGWGSNGRPQEYIGIVPAPEPASIMLLGAGLLGLAEAVRRKSKIQS